MVSYWNDVDLVRFRSDDDRWIPLGASSGGSSVPGFSEKQASKDAREAELWKLRDTKLIWTRLDAAQLKIQTNTTQLTEI